MVTKERRQPPSALKQKQGGRLDYLTRGPRKGPMLLTSISEKGRPQKTHRTHVHPTSTPSEARFWNRTAAVRYCSSERVFRSLAGMHVCSTGTHTKYTRTYVPSIGRRG